MISLPERNPRKTRPVDHPWASQTLAPAEPPHPAAPAYARSAWTPRRPGEHALVATCVLHSGWQLPVAVTKT